MYRSLAQLFLFVALGLTFFVTELEGKVCGTPYRCRPNNVMDRPGDFFKIRLVPRQCYRERKAPPKKVRTPCEECVAENCMWCRDNNSMDVPKDFFKRKIKCCKCKEVPCKPKKVKKKRECPCPCERFAKPPYHCNEGSCKNCCF